MALKDDVLNNYFKAPLSRRRKVSEGSESPERSGPTLPQKRRYFHDDYVKVDLPLQEEEHKNKKLEVFKAPEKILFDKTSDAKDLVSIDNKNNIPLGFSLQTKKKVVEQKNSETTKGRTHNPATFFSTAPSAFKELSILIKKTKGLQKNVLLYIVDKCRSSGSLDSGPIDLTDISNKYNSATDFVRTAIKRLLAKNLILKGNGKTGPTGYSVFYIPREVKEIILNFQNQL